MHDAWIPLSSLWTWAERELEVSHIIRSRVKSPNFTKKVVEPLTEDDMRKLVYAAGNTQTWVTRGGRRTHSKRPTALRDKAIILVLADTGLRASELCALTVGDYDEKRGRLHIRYGKGDKARYVVAGNSTQNSHLALSG